MLYLKIGHYDRKNVLPAANTIWNTVPMVVGPPRFIVLRAPLKTYPADNMSPVPVRSRQLQQPPNKGFGGLAPDCAATCPVGESPITQNC